ncbi:choice-of-anchor Q domain-containing protein [Massilia sp. PWRC2]|uniref:choice-of-anchor Q domain-containing protein n=1 Tax=Massilia sp. PWRC2 TaxID=2804626 RepID=UPI003CF74CC9
MNTINTINTLNTLKTVALTVVIAGTVSVAHAHVHSRAGAGVVPASPVADVAASIYHLYVSPSGSDSNSGSISAPFRTIGKAAGVAKPSTTVHVAPGSYGNVSNSKSGTAVGRLRFVSDTKWGAKIVGTGTEAHFTNSGSYVDIVGFDIAGSGRLGILNYGSFTSIEGNHVHDLKISGGCNGDGGAGIVDANYTATDDDIIGNVVHDIGVPGSCNGVQGIYHSNLRGKIYNNIVYRVSAWGIHLWHAANNVVIANNTVFRNGSASMGGGIEAGSGDSPGGIVLNNTTIANNVVYDNPGASITQYCYDGVACIGSSNVTENNLVYGNGRGVALRVGTAVATVASNPQFVNYLATGAGDYRLKSTSPGVNRGSSRNAPLVDIDGRARPLGGAIDIGAYENY